MPGDPRECRQHALTVFDLLYADELRKAEALFRQD